MYRPRNSFWTAARGCNQKQRIRLASPLLHTSAESLNGGATTYQRALDATKGFRTILLCKRKLTFKGVVLFLDFLSLMLYFFVELFEEVGVAVPHILVDPPCAL